ncbi:hypothetical protein [Massilia sp.]|uniref:hypothetical protein n=1 Tax=Massilia sp. TaxID=1882437 RepID=UPI00391A8F1E
MMNDTGELIPVANAADNAGSVRRQRTDIRTRDLINQAVASIPTLGLQRAAEFLATMNVPAEVAVRVLVYPNRRRIN